MKQGLVITIEDRNSNVLATAYYQWLGYTDPAVKKTYHILSNLNTRITDPPQRMAHILFLLFRAGADLHPEEFDLLDRNFTSLYGIVRPDKTDIYSGIIAVSETRRKQFMRRAEGIVKINIDERTVSFNVHRPINMSPVVWAIADTYFQRELKRTIMIDIGTGNHNMTFEDFAVFKDTVTESNSQFYRFFSRPQIYCKI